MAIGVFAVTQGCCQPVLQSSTQQWEMQSAKRSAAAQWCWVTSDLCGEQMAIGVFAVIQGCCQPVLQSSTEQWVLQFARISVAVHWS